MDSVVNQLLELTIKLNNKTDIASEVHIFNILEKG